MVFSSATRTSTRELFTSRIYYSPLPFLVSSLIVIDKVVNCKYAYQIGELKVF